MLCTEAFIRIPVLDTTTATYVTNAAAEAVSSAAALQPFTLSSFFDDSADPCHDIEAKSDKSQSFLSAIVYPEWDFRLECLYQNMHIVVAYYTDA